VFPCEHVCPAEAGFCAINPKQHQKTEDIPRCPCHGPEARKEQMKVDTIDVGKLSKTRYAAKQLNKQLDMGRYGSRKLSIKKYMARAQSSITQKCETTSHKHIGKYKQFRKPVVNTENSEKCLDCWCIKRRSR
jgi:hypothetical protein